MEQDQVLYFVTRAELSEVSIVSEGGIKPTISYDLMTLNIPANKPDKEMYEDADVIEVKQIEQ